jgi:UDP-N-acetylglucosamine:LPS N-acetylglucosamine transferase
MKILFTGGGSGGHFYPIIAISKEINEIAKKEKALPPEIFFMAPKLDAEIRGINVSAKRKRVAGESS